jgi:hypothetical protein
VVHHHLDVSVVHHHRDWSLAVAHELPAVALLPSPSFALAFLAASCLACRSPLGAPLLRLGLLGGLLHRVGLGEVGRGPEAVQYTCTRSLPRLMPWLIVWVPATPVKMRGLR